MSNVRELRKRRLPLQCDWLSDSRMNTFFPFFFVFLKRTNIPPPSLKHNEIFFCSALLPLLHQCKRKRKKKREQRKKGGGGGLLLCLMQRSSISPHLHGPTRNVPYGTVINLSLLLLLRTVQGKHAGDPDPNLRTNRKSTAQKTLSLFVRHLS